MILVDTNILIEIYRDNQSIIEKVRSIGQENIAVSVITSAELMYGARNKNELQTILKDLKKISVLNLDTEISIKFGQLIEKYALSHKLSLPDALIAATAICRNLPLYTLNTKDFKYIKEVKLFEI
jgi:predicted nucleic acid-binding protein